MAEVDSSLIKHGFWINYSQGQVLGATLTTDQRTSNVVVALLAVIVSIAVGSAWNLVLFTLYQTRSTVRSKDGLFWQQQALYRTLAAPGAVLVDSFKFMAAWRGRYPGSTLRRYFLPVALGLLFLLGGLAAGVFSSYVVNTTSLEVLVAGDKCRFLNLTAAAYDDTGSGYYDGMYSLVDSYARQCYLPDALPTQCGFYVHPRIVPTLEFADCPFPPELCMNGSKAATLDSGYLDSNDVFAINAHRKDRVFVRRRSTCAPLDISKYTTYHNDTDPIVVEAVGKGKPEYRDIEWWWAYHLGQAGGPGNITAMHDTLTSNVSTSIELFPRVAYQSEDLQDTGRSFYPIEPLVVEKGDLSVIFIYANALRSYTPIDDPIYAAHDKFYDEAWDQTLYHQDRSVGVLGCVELWEFCVQSTLDDLECTPSHGVESGWERFKRLLPSANDVQIATLELLAAGAYSTGLLAGAAATSPFLNITSREALGTLINVPADQWVHDFQSLENFAWAFAQVGIAMPSTGFAGFRDIETFSQPPMTELQHHVCRNQKVVKPGGFANINVFGLSFILAVTGSLLFLDFIVLRVYVVRGQFKRIEGVQSWIDDGVYQLQRRIYELHESTDWERTDKEVPVTKRGERLRGVSTYAKSPSPNTSISSDAGSTAFCSATTGDFTDATPAISLVTPANTQNLEVKEMALDAALTTQAAVNTPASVMPSPSTAPSISHA